MAHSNFKSIWSTIDPTKLKYVMPSVRMVSVIMEIDAILSMKKL